MREETVEASPIRNLEEIQEADDNPRSRLGALVLASFGGACIVFAAIGLMRMPSAPRPIPVDPLGELVARAQVTQPKPGQKREVVSQDVTFPETLSDAQSKTTALEVVRDLKPGAVPEQPALASPPPAADQLPVVPLPAQQVLNAPLEQVPAADVLGVIAKHASRDEGQENAPGGPGGYQIQVSSFKVATEAEAFAAALRRRGHRAYVEPANVKGRGLWHRVRIGPFKQKLVAAQYRKDFEQKEKLVTFVVEPKVVALRD